MNLKEQILNRDFDEIFAVLGIVFSLFLIVYSYTQPTRFIVGILTLLSCITWLFIRKNASLKLEEYNFRRTNIIVVILLLFLFILSVLSIHFRSNLYERPLLFFVFISLMISLILIQILIAPKNLKGLILLEILIISLFISWSQLFLFTDLLGIDPWWHRMFTLQIIDGGHIPKELTYSKLPIFHLLITAMSLISGLEYKTATIMSVSFSQTICNILFIYLLANHIFNNHKIGLLSALLAIISNNHIYMTYWSIPNGFGLVFIAFIFYLLFKMKINHYIISKLLMLYIMLLLILTHSITSMYMAIVLFAMFVGFKIYNSLSSKKEALYSINYPILFLVCMLSWWTFASHHLSSLTRIIKWGFSIDIFIETPKEVIAENLAAISFTEQFITIMGMFLFFALSFIGCFYMISQKYGNSITFCIAIAGLIPLFLGFFSETGQGSIIEDRWFYFAQYFLSIPLAVSFYLLYDKLKRNTSLAIVSLFLVIFFSFLLIVSPVANIDNHKLYPNSAARSVLTNSELQALSSICSMHNGDIKTDNYYAYVASYTCKASNFDEELYNREVYLLDQDLILIRKEILEHAFTLYSSTYNLDYDILYTLNNLRKSKIYNCGSVDGFITTEKQVMS